MDACVRDKPRTAGSSTATFCESTGAIVANPIEAKLQIAVRILELKLNKRSDGGTTPRHLALR